MEDSLKQHVQQLHWVFGYGSLIWNPGFPYVQSQRATLFGAHRRLCIYSHRHRGTPEQPGLVFGLLPGGSCPGMAFAVEPRIWPEVHDYLTAREMDSGIYREAMRPIRLADGGRLDALAFTVVADHVQYAGKLELAEQVRLVRRGVGESGPNPEYVVATARHLAKLGIRDRRLEALVAALGDTDLPMAETV